MYFPHMVQGMGPFPGAAGFPPTAAQAGLGAEGLSVQVVKGGGAATGGGGVAGGGGGLAMAVADHQLTSLKQHQEQLNQQHQQHQQQHQYQYNYRQQTSFRYLRLIWDEKDHTLEYTLRFNSSRPGFWISSAPQSGTMIQLPYVQFTGTVQVLKAINNQLVLTFCQSVPGGQLFSVVLTRQPMGLSPEENQSIRNFLRRKHLSTTSMRKVCFSAASNQASLGLATSIWIVLALQFFTKKN